MSLRDYQIRPRPDGVVTIWVSRGGRPPKKAAAEFKTIQAAKTYITRMRRRTTGAYQRAVDLGAARRKKLLDRLADAAKKREPMPSNRELAILTDSLTKSGFKTMLSRHLIALEAAGSIRIVRGAHVADRKVIICATGESTAWQLRREYKPKAPSSPKPPNRPRVDRPMAYVSPRPFSAGYSDTFLYGHLADSVRACRRHGDVIYRNPRCKTEILINGSPGDPKERAAWHASRAQIQRMNPQVIHSNP